MKKGIKNGILCVVAMFFIAYLVSCYMPPVQTLFNTEMREQYQLFREIMPEYRSYGLRFSINSMSSNEENNSKWYWLHVKTPPSLLREKKFTPEIVNEIRIKMNQYLNEHPKYLLDDEHELNVSIDTADMGNILLHNRPDYIAPGQITHETGFDYLSLVVTEKDFISTEDILAFEGLKGVRLNQDYSVQDIVQLAEKGTLDYISLDTIYLEAGSDLNDYKRIDLTETVLKEIAENEALLRNYRIESRDGYVIFMKITDRPLDILQQFNKTYGTRCSAIGQSLKLSDKIS